MFAEDDLLACNFGRRAGLQHFAGGVCHSLARRACIRTTRSRSGLVLRAHVQAKDVLCGLSAGVWASAFMLLLV